MSVQALRIIHPTDFSEKSDRAFAHALKLALASRGELFLLHIDTHANHERHWSEFPHVRETLAAWGLLDTGSSQKDVSARLGIQIAKFDIGAHDIASGVGDFTEKYGGDAIVLATEGRRGLAGLLHESQAAAILRRTHMATLFVPQGATGFVDPQCGEVTLKRIVVPVDHKPNPLRAVRELVRIMGPLGLTQDMLMLIHAGNDAPAIRAHSGAAPAPVTCLPGSVVPTILDAASDADLIVMATAGHHGILDALRGSTTEQIVRLAERPVLAIPAP